MFTNGNNRPITFASFNSKEGLFVLKDKEGNKSTYTQVRDITISSLKVEDDTYEGQPLKKLRVRAANTNGDVSVTFNLAAGATAKLVALLANADMSAPLGISAQTYKAGSAPKFMNGEVLKNDLVMMSVYQKGKYVRPVEGMPKVVMVKVGNKEVADTSARDAWVEGKIAEIQSKLTGKIEHEDEEPPVFPPSGPDVEDLPEDLPF
jgi:hypothetical protein